MLLREYQQDAANAAIKWIKKTTEPCLLELATGAGKSLIAAAIAKWINQNTQKKVLVLQPSKELTEQNFLKYLATGEKASIFSASTGKKCTKNPVIYGTPKTVLNSIDIFGDKFGAVIIDEAHMTTLTIKEIIEAIRLKNPLLRVIGMTATPYRLKTGYIYQYDATGQRVKKLDEEETISPYYHSLVYRITTRELIEMGFLTNAHTDTANSSVIHYDTENLTLNKMGQFDAKEVERAVEGQCRLTASIVEDVVSHAQNRVGVMLFASTVNHAKEILDSLPPHNSRMIGGDINMAKQERELLINDFKAKRFKYIVSVGTLTTGFDAPHVDLVAVLRPTESQSLFQQIIGRGLRLCDGKNDCLVLDYAQNIERHGLEQDIFVPTIETYKPKASVKIEVECPACEFINEFSVRENENNLKIDKQGFFIDLAKNRILLEDGSFYPAHKGRRCNGFVQSKIQKGALDRCEHRWAVKTCESCSHENDIAARYCESCKAELVDPNEKLSIEASKAKKNPYEPCTEEVLFFKVERRTSKAGNDMMVVDYTTNTNNFRDYVLCNPEHFGYKKWIELNIALFGNDYPKTLDDFFARYTNQQPDTITYKKNQKHKYSFDVLGHNNPILFDDVS